MNQLENRVPDFLVIGAMKAGTTTLWEILRQVEGLYVSPTKEPDVFSSEMYDEEHAIRDFASLFKGAQTGDRVGECSTSYTKHSMSSISAARAKQLCGPDLRLVYCVRNPIERLVSHFKHLNAVGKSDEILADELHGRHGLIENGLYSECISPWVEEFGRDQLLVVNFDEVAAGDASVFTAVATHCGGVEHSSISVDAKLNSASAFKPRKGSLLYRLNRSGAYRYGRNLLPAGVRRFALEAAGSVDRRVAPRPEPVITLNPELLAGLIMRYETDMRDFSAEYPFAASWDIEATANRLLR